MERNEGQSDGPRHVVMTGGSSGIGLQAASRLLAAGHRLTVLCRDAATADRLRQRLSSPLPAAPASQLSTPIADLADLTSVATAAEALRSAGDPIDTLVLNAGLQYSGAPAPRWSSQGFELTLAVNHLAHQALLQRLLPLLQRSAAPRLVVTASEVHDPASAGGKVGAAAGLGELAGLRQGPGAAMVAGGPFSAEKAYKDSKLCNVLLAREVERRLRQRGQLLPVVAWSPGLVIPRGEGGFFRDSRAFHPVGQALFAFLARDLLRLTATPEQAGALLARLATGAPPAAEGFSYWSNRVQGPGRLRFERAEPSAEARSDALAAELWRLTAERVGLGEERGLEGFGSAEA
ncbi:MAG: SDR family NAD(P)-dependent oxidoreductase [Cyanobacteriota bacterium]|nr:SDR family NAD(P)-dependent oxidoreductase [Cyanobacteriota bacterium]